MAYLIEIPEVTCGNGLHTQTPAQEPVFHFSQLDGHHGIAGLETVRSWARSMHEDGVPLEEIVSDLHVMLPGGTRLIRCTLNVVGNDEDGLELEVEALRATSLISNILYSCEI